MSVYRPKNSPYFHVDFVWQGYRIYGSTGCRNVRDAKEFERRERLKLSLPALQRPQITVDEACGLYQDKVESKPSWPTTRYQLQRLIEMAGPRTLLSAVDQATLQAWVWKRRAKVSDASVNRELETFRAVFRWAARNRFDVGEMPDWGALLLPIRRKAPRELTGAEEARLLPALREDIEGAVRFALLAGWRRREVISLLWSNVDLGARTARTTIKGGDEIVRPLTDDMVAIIADQPRVGPFVFTYICQKSRGSRDPRQRRVKGERYPLTTTALRKPWDAARKLADIESFRFHDLRHTRGTRILRATGNLAAAQKALGHRHIKTTLIYAHAADDDVRDALAASANSTGSKELKPNGHIHGRTRRKAD